MIKIPKTYFFKFENWGDYKYSLVLGKDNILFLSSSLRFGDFPTVRSNWYFDADYLYLGGTVTRYKIVKTNQEFMKSIREEFELFPRIKFCVLNDSFSDVEIQDMNDFIDYLLEKG